MFGWLFIIYAVYSHIVSVSIGIFHIVLWKKFENARDLQNARYIGDSAQNMQLNILQKINILFSQKKNLHMKLHGHMKLHDHNSFQLKKL